MLALSQTLVNMICRIILIALILPCLYSCQGKLLKEQISQKDEQIAQLESQLDHLQNSNTSLLDRLSDLSVISKNESASIQNSLESLNRQNEYIQNLTSKIHEKDSINLALVTNLKRSLDDFNDDDIQINVEGSAVYVSISDKMLFRSGSAALSENANAVLNKVSKIINDHGDMNVLVEGHTDNVPIRTDKLKDNWDLSVLRATAVVRRLQDKYQVDSTRLTAAGRSEFTPKSDNETKIGKSENRRTEIIITPQLGQFFELLKAPELLG